MILRSPRNLVRSRSISVDLEDPIIVSDRTSAKPFGIVAEQLYRYYQASSNRRISIAHDDHCGVGCRVSACRISTCYTLRQL